VKGWQAHVAFWVGRQTSALDVFRHFGYHLAKRKLVVVEACGYKEDEPHVDGHEEAPEVVLLVVHGQVDVPAVGEDDEAEQCKEEVHVDGCKAVPSDVETHKAHSREEEHEHGICKLSCVNTYWRGTHWVDLGIRSPNWKFWKVGHKWYTPEKYPTSSPKYEHINDSQIARRDSGLTDRAHGDAKAVEEIWVVHDDPLQLL
jgi:hypothetical protein